MTHITELLRGNPCPNPGRKVVEKMTSKNVPTCKWCEKPYALVDGCTDPYPWAYLYGLEPHFLTSE